MYYVSVFTRKIMPFKKLHHNSFLNIFSENGMNLLIGNIETLFTRVKLRFSGRIALFKTILMTKNRIQLTMLTLVLVIHFSNSIITKK